MTRRRLPIGVESFRELREGNYYYVDKTAHIARLASEPKYCRFSRPRRFGKSLLLDTMKELFEGNEALFEGLAVHGEWDWSVCHPVVRLSFGDGHFREPGQAEASLTKQLDALEREAGVRHGGSLVGWRLHGLLRALHERTGRGVAVLVDDYDKPALDALDLPDVARANRDFVNGFYGSLKGADAHVHCALLMGESGMLPSGFFSGLNTVDLSLDRGHATICGFTDAELDDVFASELHGLDRDAVRDWYSGYNWRGEAVYNPYDILRLFDRREFMAHWFEAGPPTPLVDTVLRQHVGSSREETIVTEHRLGLELEHVLPEALLFQAGYLTIVKERDIGSRTFFWLGYPNRAVKQGLERLQRATGADATPPETVTVSTPPGSR